LSTGLSERAIEWLLSSSDPSVRYLTLVDVLGEPAQAEAARSAREQVPSGARVRALLEGQRPDGGFGVDPYSKWSGGHWRLVSLVELAVPPDELLRPATDSVLDWLNSEDLFDTVNGLARIHASVPGNAVAYCCLLGLSGDPRVRALVDVLLATQWPDGGWNCDENPDASHSSFYESLATIWGLIEYAKATGDGEVLRAVDRGVELFLARRLFRSMSSGEVIDPEWLRLHYPAYWHYDILQALTILSRADKLKDSRVDEALDIIESKRDDNGRWRPEGYYWGRRDELESSCLDDAPNTEAVDWGRDGPNEMITLNALRVLRAAGRL
jgi:hypothetical protein